MSDTATSPAPPTAQPTQSHVSVPATILYTATLPRPPGRLTHRVVIYAAEGLLPRPLDELALAWKPAGNSLIVLAIDREHAEAWLAQGAASAQPATLPPSVLEHDPSVKNTWFEFLRGRHLPSQIVAQRRLRRVVVMMVAVGLAGLVAWGAHRRSEAMVAEAKGFDAASSALVKQALPGMTPGMDPQLALTGEIRRLTAIADADRITVPVDGRYTMTALFEQWPGDITMQVESIEVAGGRVHLHANLATRRRALELASALTELTGFEAELPTIRTETRRGSNVTHLELALQRKARGAR